jgi:hypothetical protein
LIQTERDAIAAKMWSQKEETAQSRWQFGPTHQMMLVVTESSVDLIGLSLLAESVLASVA